MFILASFLLIALVSSQSDLSEKSASPPLKITSGPSTKQNIPSKSGIVRPLLLFPTDKGKQPMTDRSRLITEVPLQSKYADAPVDQTLPTGSRTFTPTA